MAERSPIPLVALPACRMEKGGQSYHTIGDKYVRAVAEAAGCLPMMLPSLSETTDLDDLIGKLDGLVLTGSPSNVHPEHYGDAPSEKAEPYDPARDAVTLPLIRKAAAAGLPLLAICRGLQELNVAFGGTLYPKVHEVAGRADHRRPEADDLETQYGPRHSVELAPDGALSAAAGRRAGRGELPAPPGGARDRARAQARGLGPRRHGGGAVPPRHAGLPHGRAVAPGIPGHRQPGIRASCSPAFAEAARARARLRQNVRTGASGLLSKPAGIACAAGQARLGARSAALICS
ncbi:MAG: gamma-glutamyl-gamma-aminobutyrate hydrolase family protein [Rhodovibrio sp.]|nr:gamma-glutamyl-gamma-aminobutyrate hydrolase family protein [Rhodovibrio sp.]